MYIQRQEGDTRRRGGNTGTHRYREVQTWEDTKDAEKTLACDATGKGHAAIKGEAHLPVH